MTVATSVDLVSPHASAWIWSAWPDWPLASLPASFDLLPYTTIFGATVRLETRGAVTVTVPRKLFLLLAGSENRNLPAFEKVQLALAPPQSRAEPRRSSALPPSS